MLLIAANAFIQCAINFLIFFKSIPKRNFVSLHTWPMVSVTMFDVVQVWIQWLNLIQQEKFLLHSLSFNSYLFNFWNITWELAYHQFRLEKYYNLSKLIPILLKYFPSHSIPGLKCWWKGMKHFPPFLKNWIKTMAMNMVNKWMGVLSIPCLRVLRSEDFLLRKCKT